MEVRVRNLALMSVVALSSLWALADQVTLKNADRLTGTIVQSDGTTLVLHTDYAGDISLKWDAVQAINSNEMLHLQLQNGKTLAGPVTTVDGKLQVSTSSGTVGAPVAEVKTL